MERYKTVRVFAVYGLWIMVLMSLGACNAIKQESVTIENAQLDLATWDFQEQGTVSFSGDWEFYWKEKFTKKEDLYTVESKQYSTLPGFWTESSSWNHADKPYGYATYHVKLLLPDTASRHFLKLNSLYTAYELWGNDDLLFQAGTVGKTRETTVSHFQTGLIELPQAKEIDLFLQIASWDYRLGGGVLDQMIIGTESQIWAAWKRNVAIQFSSFLFLLTVSFYVLTLYLLNRKHKSYLYVALFAIAGGIRAICVDEMIIQELIEGFPYFLNQRFRYMGFFMSIGFVSLLINEIFQKYNSKFLVLGFYIALVFSVSMFVFPFSYTCYLSHVFQFIAIPMVFTCLYIVGKTVSKHWLSVVVLLSSGSGVLALVAYALFVDNKGFSLAYSYNFGYVIFIASQALSLAYLHNKNQQAANSLAKELLVLNKNLEEKVVERTLEIENQQEALRIQRDQISEQAEELKYTNKRLQELDMAKTHFFANISHELRTPLAVILGNLKRLKGDLAGTESERHVNVSERQGTLLIQLINQLLDITKLEAGKMKLRPTKEPLIKLMKSYVEAFDSLTAQKNIQLIFSSNVSSYETLIDWKALEKIIYNLMANAYKFTEENGQIDVAIEVKEPQILIEVRDTGIGIEKSQLPNIFNRFYQVEKSLDKINEGTGIGLALVKELVELQEGSIEVESHVGKGTCFRITLPILQDMEIAEFDGEESMLAEKPILPNIFKFLKSKKQKQVPKASGNPLVLVVEDHPDLQELILDELTEHYRVIQAFNGRQGLEMALEHMPDFIISDVMMPYVNGFELCQQLKSNRQTSHIPIVLLTARAEKEDRLHGLQLGADDYLAKPFDTKELKVRIHNLIEIRKQLQVRYATKTELVIFEPNQHHNLADKTFVSELESLLSRYYHEGNFGVDDFAKHMNMSKRHLNRKLNSMIGSSASKLLQNYRLQQATEFLKESDLSIGEVGYRVGFSSRAYFNKCFREKFGETPKNYRNKQSEVIG